ncbi:MAG: hypothetical protein ACT4PG_00355 [Panacagrimonas sp.]
MFITKKSLWIATYRIFQDHRIQIGCSLEMRQLMLGWSATGLRQSDLASGLESLVNAKFVTLEVDAEGMPCVRLLSEEFGMLRPNGTDEPALASLEKIRILRHRPPSHLAGLVAASSGARRVEDKSQAYA